MKNKGILPLLAILFAVIVLGGTAMLGASSKTSVKHEIYEKGDALKAIGSFYDNDKEKGNSWIEDLDRVIPPEEQERIRNSESSELTTTERFIASLFKRIGEDPQITSKDSFSEINVNDLKTEKYEVFMKSFVEKEIQSILDSQPFLKQSDIKTQKDPSKSSIRSYGEKMGEIILENSPDLDHELKLFNELVINGDRQARFDLIEISKGYKNIAEEAALVSAPEEIAEDHLDFVNNMKKNGIFLEKMSEVEKDPLLALISAEGYFSVSPDIQNTAKNVSDFYQQKEIDYGPYDKGRAYTFMNYLDEMSKTDKNKEK